jgi:uncharacterized protein
MADDRNQFRPDFKRQMLYAGILLAAILSAYMVVTLIVSPSEQPVVKSVQDTQPRSAWYKDQSPPPKMITTPDLPLFPEVENETAQPELAARAYEEALPKETYEPPVVIAAQPALIPVPVPKPVSVPIPAPKPEKPPQVASLPKQIETTELSMSLPRWRKFAVNVPVSGEVPLIAVVIDDMGVDKKRSAMAIDLKGPLTLSFLTYATDLESQTLRAAANGHELMLHVSMEPSSSAVDPGPNALLTHLSNEELHQRLEWGFGRFSTYVGVNNHMGSKFTSDSKAMRIVIEEIKHRGLLFLDSRTSSHTVGAKLARKLGVPVAERNIFLDHENTVEAVNKQLQQVEKMARRNGFVIAIGHPRDATIKALQVWLKDIESRDFQLVPVTTIVSRTGVP